MFIEWKRIRIYPAAILVSSLIGSLFSPVYATPSPHTQEFVVTAYYSPKPNQCCYFRGSYAEEIMFNGEGVHGADGTLVYPGMIAAPSTYPFGTVIDLPGIGVGTVHDRGSRITEWGDDLHRIDLWMGEGEEGLARAMAWGVRRVTGVVYPAGSDAIPTASFDLSALPSNPRLLQSLATSDPVRLMASTAFGDSSYAVRVLQGTLRDAGYFEGSVTGQFGNATKQAVKEFIGDMRLPGDGSAVDRRTAAALAAWGKIRPENLPDLAVGLQPGMSGPAVGRAQRILRFLGAYRGRTSTQFDANLRNAVLAFQKAHGLVADATVPGAGRIGPATRAMILKEWKRTVVEAKAGSMVLKLTVEDRVRDTVLPAQLLARGDKGSDVRRLQTLLKNAGYLDVADVTGTFGARTERAMERYQLDHRIVVSAEERGAGIFGPATKASIAKEAVEVAWKQVRESGMQSF